MYDEKVLKVFLDDQLKLFPELVAEDLDDAAEFLEASCAVVVEDEDELMEYLDEAGVDTEGMSMEEILEQPEVFAVGDGRYLVLEV